MSAGAASAVEQLSLLPATARPPMLALPAQLAPWRDRLHLGTSSWVYSGWRGIVYPGDATPAFMSRDGLADYARHPLLSAAGVDRSFYAPLPEAQYAAWAAQTPSHFRFLVKAPAAVTDAVVRDAGGRASRVNPGYLDAAQALAAFVEPCRRGLGERLGVLLFQFSPLPPPLLEQPAAWVDRLHDFLRALPPGLPYAVEVRDAAVVTPRLVAALRDVGVGYCIGLHDRMPTLERQLRAHDHLLQGRPGPLVLRWTLRAGLDYASAAERYAPFDRIVDPDVAIREGIARAAAATLRAGQPVLVIVNNKAEGCAPLTLAALAEAIAITIGGSSPRD